MTRLSAENLQWTRVPSFWSLWSKPKASCASIISCLVRSLVYRETGQDSTGKPSEAGEQDVQEASNADDDDASFSPASTSSRPSCRVQARGSWKTGVARAASQGIEAKLSTSLWQPMAAYGS